MNRAAPQHDAPTIATTRTDTRRGADWKFALMAGLAAQSVRRIFTAAEFHYFVQTYRPGASASTARETSNLLASAGTLRRVASGVFLNLRAVPPAELSEADSHIRAGAIISLHTVLGENGFLNNPSGIVTAVLPTSTSKRPRLGEVMTSAGYKFRFYGIAEKFFPMTSEGRFDLLQPGRPCEMFRPERLRVFRSCPLSTPESASSSLQVLAIARYGCALRLDLPLSGGLLGHSRKTLSL
ncbi:hypothetical protein [Massilia glaciei]|uniref:hypothetical protein n=1 Tax=Massilia glaciei TaxID=1524097 RepID=UPI0011B28B22|nr:hypothetical protein [Massilia glaciei]